MYLEFPTGPVALDSNFYIERPPLEELAYQEINKPGSLIRIKAPSAMGKSSLLIRVMARAKAQDYKTVWIDFQEIEEANCIDLNTFLRWFCANVARQLLLKPLLDQYWDEELGSKVSCTIYFERYLLQEINSPIVLALNEVNRIFEYAHIAREFLPLLRFWYEKARQNEAFKKLRLVAVLSTEVYISLKTNQSPFNVGLPIQLPPFNLEQIQTLAQRYGLDWNDCKAQQLITMIGGHPYLVQLALYHLSLGKISLEKLLQEAPYQTGIYSSHLQRYLGKLKKEPELLTALKQVVTAKQNVQLEPQLAYKLYSMGLVKLNGNECTPSCQLYRLYFGTQDFTNENLVVNRVQELEQENKHLKDLVNKDSLTKIANRRYFDSYLMSEWGQMAVTGSPLSLILLDIDCFKIYNDSYGHQEGDRCLQQVAQALCSCMQRRVDVVARYGGEEFAVILPQTNLADAVEIAEMIREKIKALAIEHIHSHVNLGVVTASLGVASTIPKLKDSPVTLLQAADRALYQSKANGRDRVTACPLDFNFETLFTQESLQGFRNKFSESEHLF